MRVFLLRVAYVRVFFLNAFPSSYLCLCVALGQRPSPQVILSVFLGIRATMFRPRTPVRQRTAQTGAISFLSKSSFLLSFFLLFCVCAYCVCVCGVCVCVCVCVCVSACVCVCACVGEGGGGVGGEGVFLVLVCVL